MTVNNQREAEDMIYRSYLRAAPMLHAAIDAGAGDDALRRPDLTRRLLDGLGAPDRGRRFVLVAGSKGKGSTSRLVSSLLSHMGFKVGLFTSPHLVDYRERIRIDGRAIAEADFVRLARRAEPIWRELEAELERGAEPAAYQGPVGVSLAIASCWFAEQDTDINVIECGRGGRYDDTNVLANEWAVVTHVLEEHVRELGPAIRDIVRHKLGIVKAADTRIYVGAQREDVLGLIKMELAAKETPAGGSGGRGWAAAEEAKNAVSSAPGIGADMHRSASLAGEDFAAAGIAVGPDGTAFDVRTTRTVYRRLRLPLFGEFQAHNAAVAVQLCEDIADAPLDEALIARCFGRLQWPGRCEIVGRAPLAILDGAIHRDSAAYVARLVASLGLPPGADIAAVVGVPRDKDYAGVIETLAAIAGRILVTRPDVSHLAFPDDALEVARRYRPHGSAAYPQLADALAALRKTAPQPDVILIVGTQTLIGNAKRLYGQTLEDIGK